MLQRHSVRLLQFSLASPGEEGEVAELVRIAGDDNAPGALEDRQTSGDVALGCFINDRQVEQLFSQRQHVVNVGQVCEPNRKGCEQDLEVNRLEQVFLLAAGPGADRLQKSSEFGPMPAQRVAEPAAVEQLEQESGLVNPLIQQSFELIEPLPERSRARDAPANVAVF